MSRTYEITEGETESRVRVTLRDATGPVRIQGAAIFIRYRDATDEQATAFSDAMLVLDDGTEPLKGKAEYEWDWATLPVPTPGVYVMKFKAVFAPASPDETVSWFPNDEPDILRIYPSIGA